MFHQNRSNSRFEELKLRRRNFIQPDQFPYDTPVALTYDTGDFEAILSSGLAASDWNGFEASVK